MTFESYFQEVLETLSLLGYNDIGDLEKDAKNTFNSQIPAYKFAESVMSDKSWFEKLQMKAQWAEATKNMNHIQKSIFELAANVAYRSMNTTFLIKPIKDI